MRRSRSVYLVKRGSEPIYNKAPWHPLILCDDRRVAEYEVGWTGDGAWSWQTENSPHHGGWLLDVWNGFPINYGSIVRSCELPDGTHCAFWRNHELTHLLTVAKWWSTREIPPHIMGLGVSLVSDRHSLESIIRVEM